MTPSLGQWLIGPHMLFIDSGAVANSALALAVIKVTYNDFKST